MNISYKSGELLWSRERTSSLTLPEKTRVSILKLARQNVENNPWCQEVNEERNHKKAEKMVENFMPNPSVFSNNTAEQKKETQNQNEGTAPLPEYDEEIDRNKLTEQDVNVRKAAERVEASYNDK